MKKAWLLLLLSLGCGTTRVTDTQRTATEQLLVSNAIDHTVSAFDFRCLAGKTVYFDPQYLDGSVDRGYLISSLRQQLLSCGATLQEDRTKANYVVEARAGGVGTDRHALLIGIPQMNVPTLLPGQFYQIPEIPFAKKTDQIGVAKVAVFAYNRQTGRPIWQSGVVNSSSTSKDTWVLGLGPFQRGTIRDGTQFAGQPLGLPFVGEDSEDGAPPVVPATQAAAWTEPAVTLEPPTLLFPIAAAGSKPAAPAEAVAPKPPTPPQAPNAGGQAETLPAQANLDWNWPNFKPDFIQQLQQIEGRAQKLPSSWSADHATRP